MQQCGDCGKELAKETGHGHGDIWFCDNDCHHRWEMREGFRIAREQHKDDPVKLKVLDFLEGL